MIAGVEGIVDYLDLDSVVVKAGAVSFLVHLPKSTLPRLGGKGSKVRLHTHLHVREDNLALYGFISSEELSLFENLISVSGVGPKLALALLSSLTPEQVVNAIISESVDVLCEVQGIGKKTASRLILELKSRLEKGWATYGLPALNPESTDVVAALTGLGYSLKEAAQAVACLPQSEELSLEDKVRMSLQRLGTK